MGILAQPVRAIALALTAAAALSSCNVYEDIDPPMNDDQLLSAARACFDRGDVACAAEHYGKLSGSKGDIKLAEEAYAILDHVGVDLGTFIRVFGSGKSGSGLLDFASILSFQAGETKRREILSAYRKVSAIGNAKLRGVLRFVTSLTLLGEILGEEARDGHLDLDEIARNPGACATVTETVCLAAVAVKRRYEIDNMPESCKAPIGGVIQDRGDPVSLDHPDTTLVGPPTLEMIHGVIKKALTGLDEVGVGETFKKLSEVISKVEAIEKDIGGISAAPECYRNMLVRQLGAL